MTREEAIDVLKHNYPSSCYEDLCKAVDMAIKALEEPEPSQVARDIATIIENEQDMRVMLSQPERKKGKWLPIIEVNENGEPYQAGVYCSECGNGEVYEPNFCSCCGADLRGEKNEQTN